MPNELSGGMRKRAGLARAMVLDPSVLLCDEPSAGLDPITAASLDQLILDLNETFGMTIVVVTHDLDSLFTIAEFVVVLHGGHVLYQGGPKGLKESEDQYIQQFLKRIPNQRDLNGPLKF
jgi:phospholipid/cholesterol/gamma-HCH transport system ATP-binding protein